ncbi:MAG: hypothetical protein PHG85_04255 [Candidatus Altiarchaeota archaeon]|nr:hypothetical protein [Candidatus Altiarchaeota archaeon]
MKPWVVLAVGLSLSIVLLLAFILAVPTGTTTPGTTQPARQECAADTDCGSTGYTGVYKCRGDSIFGEYVTRICTPTAGGGRACTSVGGAEYVEYCPTPLECKDGKGECQTRPTTTTRPLVYGSEYTLAPRITTTTIQGTECARDESCGIDHYGKPYCSSSGHSVRDYITYTCQNPGTYASRCTREKVTYLVDYCGSTQSCIRGECVEKRRLSWYCIREDCCATDFSLCEGASVDFLPFPVVGRYNSSYVPGHNTTIYP